MSLILSGVTTGAPKIVGLQVGNGTTVTGTTGAVISATITVAANILATNSILEFVWTTNRVSGNNNVIQSQVWVNTSNTLSGATQIATGANLSAAQWNVKGGRDVQKLNTTAVTYPAANQVASDYSVATGAQTSLTLNNANTLFFLFACNNLSASDSSYIHKIRITEYA